MAKFKIEGTVVEIEKTENFSAANDATVSCTPFVILSNDTHPSNWYFRAYGEQSNLAARLKEGDLVEVEFTSKDKKTNGRWHSNKQALLIKILDSAKSNL